jgi:tetratricopeptide (TPR) repeat protein
MRTAVAAALATLVAAASAARARADTEEDQVDHLALAERLVADGHYDRAEAELRAVDTTLEELDRGLYHFLRGLTALHGGNYKAARDGLMAAVTAGNTKPAVYLALAQAHFGAKEWEPTLRALDSAGEAAAKLPAAHITRAQCHWQLGQRAQALGALEVALQRFSSDLELERMRVYYLVELGLYQRALDLGLDMLARPGATSDDYLALGEALRKAKQLKQATNVLELARIRFSEDSRLLINLAHVYMEGGHLLTAAMLFEQAARLEANYAYEASELYLRAKNYERALMLNARVPDGKVKLRQRLGILIGQERWDLVTGMAPALSRLGLLEDDDVRYALAYGMFKSGDLVGAQRQLKPIRSAHLLESVNSLRRSMELCSDKPWECGT